MTRAEAIAIAKEVMIEENISSRKDGQPGYFLHEFMIALLIRLEILKVDDDRTGKGQDQG